jgi:hypothetical protein
MFCRSACSPLMALMPQHRKKRLTGRQPNLKLPSSVMIPNITDGEESVLLRQPKQTLRLLSLQCWLN